MVDSTFNTPGSEIREFRGATDPDGFAQEIADENSSTQYFAREVHKADRIEVARLISGITMGFLRGSIHDDPDVQTAVLNAAYMALGIEAPIPPDSPPIQQPEIEFELRSKSRPHQAPEGEQ